MLILPAFNDEAVLMVCVCVCVGGVCGGRETGGEGWTQLYRRAEDVPRNGEQSSTQTLDIHTHTHTQTLEMLYEEPRKPGVSALCPTPLCQGFWTESAQGDRFLSFNQGEFGFHFVFVI